MEEHSRFYQNFLNATNQRRSTASVPNQMEQEFTELLWKNGNVLMQSSAPTPKKHHPVIINEVKEDQKAVLNSTTQAMDDEIASLFQYHQYEYLEKEFGCDFLCEIPNPQAIIADKPNKSSSLHLPHYQNRSSPPPPPPKPYLHDSAQQYLYPETSTIVNFPHFSRPQKLDLSNGLHKKIHSGGESSSMMTTGSSICGSNQVQNRASLTNTISSNTATVPLPRSFKDDLETSFLSERMQTDTFEVTGTSSSGGSGVSIRAGAPEISNQGCKRKGREMEESCSLSEEGDYESGGGKKAAQRSRRSRAAEVHNLSERKRRDRINEKMKALQDLIPHCTKSDKASMLDEAIEYLKSLQQQVQIMWMGSGMATMMFPGIQNYMAHLGLGIGRSTMLQLPRVPLANPSMPSALSANQIQICPPSMNHMRFPNQMHGSQMPESFPPLLGFHHHMQASPQAMSLYAYGSQMGQQNQRAAMSRNSGMPPDGFAADKLQNGK